MLLEINGIDAATASNDDVYDLVFGIASRPSTVEGIASRLRSIIEHPSQT